MKERIDRALAAAETSPAPRISKQANKDKSPMRVTGPNKILMKILKIKQKNNENAASQLQRETFNKQVVVDSVWSRGDTYSKLDLTQYTLTKPTLRLFSRSSAMKATRMTTSRTSSCRHSRS